MRPDLSPIDPDEAVPEVRPDSGRRLRLLPVSVAVLALAGFGGIVWYAYTQGMQGGSAVAPVIRAEPGPVKIRPEQPGGLVVPNQDKMVYNNLMPGGGGAGQQGRAERLLPPPETPMPRPVAPPRPPAAEVPPPSAPAVVVPLPQPLPLPAASETASAGATQIVPPVLPQAPPSGVAAPSAQQAARVPALEPGGYRIQLAATKSEDEARREWQRLQRANTDVLGPLQLTVVRADLGPEKGVFFRIQAGPLNEASARQACDTLKGRKLGCILVR
jgi:hypothetical protein